MLEQYKVENNLITSIPFVSYSLSLFASVLLR